MSRSIASVKRGSISACGVQRMATVKAEPTGVVLTDKQKYMQAYLKAYYPKYYAKNKKKILLKGKKYRTENKDKRKVTIHNCNKAAKIRVLRHYGECCACCGESWPIFLTIDHIEGGGAKHRREINNKGGHNFYRWLIKNNFPKGFQVLCSNCNLAKHIKKICPHKTTGATHAN